MIRLPLILALLLITACKVDYLYPAQRLQRDIKKLPEGHSVWCDQRGKPGTNRGYLVFKDRGHVVMGDEYRGTC